MLVLSRKMSERIRIERDGEKPIILTAVRIGPNNVRIGIEADRSWNIVREEIASPKPLVNGLPGYDFRAVTYANPTADPVFGYFQTFEFADRYLDVESSARRIYGGRVEQRVEGMGWVTVDGPAGAATEGGEE
jgi:carbon storage regulator